MNHLTRKPKQENVVNNKYEYLGFTRNPFPIVPAVKTKSSDDRENGSIFYKDLRTKEISKFKQIILDRQNNIGLMMDYAAYRGRGIGKTAFLNHIKTKINTDLGDEMTNGNHVLFAIHIKPEAGKERKFWEISKIIIESIVQDGWIDILFARLCILTGIIPESILEEITQENIDETILDFDWLEEKGVDVQLLNNCLIGEFNEAGIEEELLSRNHYYVGSGCFHQFRNTLVGRDWNDTRWKREGLNRLFNTFVKLFKMAAFSNGIILFDEAEKIIQNQNHSERREFCDNLRYYFIDGSNENSLHRFFKVLLTIHPYSQELLLPHWNASGLERFAPLGGEQTSISTIGFTPIENRKLAIPLALAYLRKARLDGDSDTDERINPFDRDAIESAFAFSEGIPGKFLQLLYNAVEKAVSEKMNRITEAEIMKTWENKTTIHNSAMIETMPQTEMDLNEE